MGDLWDGLVTMAHHPAELAWIVGVVAGIGALLILFDAILRGRGGIR